MPAILENDRLYLSGYVSQFPVDDGFTSDDVVLCLAETDPRQPLTVHVNSGGGDAFVGAAIHALLSARPGTTNVVIDGIAASAASLIAMAGKVITMSAGSVMMIHDPSRFTAGTSTDHAKSIEQLEAVATSYAHVYAQKSGKTAEACRALMKEELWLTPSEAIEHGFANGTTQAKAVTVAAFDYRMYARAPQELLTLAQREQWSAGQNPVGPATTPVVAVDVNAIKARIKSITASADAVGREELARYLAFDTDMSADLAIAALKLAPKAAALTPPPVASSYEDRRLAALRAAQEPLTAAALAQYGRPQTDQSPVNLVETMKRRHGVK